MKNMIVNINRSDQCLEAVIAYPPEHRDRTRAKVIEAAARLFKAHGYEAVSIDRVMAEAGLTRGGFYLHFPSKKALFAAAVAEAPPPAIARAALAPGSTVEDVITAYLDPKHREAIAEGCPMAALATEMPRADGPAREAYTGNVAHFRAAIAKRLPDGLPDREQRATAIATQCIGALVLSRAVGDKELSDGILEAARNAAHNLATMRSKI
jgi:AcrR family transcriptional regulator